MDVSSSDYLKGMRKGLDLAIGLLIGMGGFAELTIIGMTIWIIKNISDCHPYQKKRLWIKDILIVNIAVLIILYWNYVDLTGISVANQFTNSGWYCPINGVETLTWQEASKAICFTLFAIVCNHIEISRVRRLVVGIATGFLIYVIPTITGSIIFQGFRVGGSKIYNIFTNELTAQSTTTGYLVIMAICIFLVTKSGLIHPTLAIGLIAGAQTSDKGLLLITTLALIFLCGSIIQQKLTLKTKYIKFLGWCMAGVILFLLIGIFKYSSSFREYFLVALGERYTLYIGGYGKLLEYLSDFKNNALSDAGISYWWHSMPLDATRAAGFVGAMTSLFWLGIIVFATVIFCKRYKFRLAFLSSAVLFIYMTSLPLQTGSYELMGLATGTMLIINELWVNPPLVTQKNQKQIL